MAIRFNCQRTCNSCRTQEIIDLVAEAGQASGLSREAGSPDDEGTRELDSPGNGVASDRTAMVVTVVLVAVLAVAVLGAAYLLNSRGRPDRFGKTNAAVDLGWDDSAEAVWDDRRATVWRQHGSVDGSHFYPEPIAGSRGTAFEPVNLDHTFAQSPSAPQHPVGPAKFYPVSSKLQPNR